MSEGVKRHGNAVPKPTRSRSQILTIRFASAGSGDNGFSHKIHLPADAASSTSAWCRVFSAQMITPSSSSARKSFTSFTNRVLNCFAAALARFRL
jgi:hypothetical protein